MIAALSPAGRAQLARLWRHGRSLLAFDFDGTLAPIVAHPPHAQASAAMRTALRRLGRHHQTAVISGRCRADLIARLGDDVGTLIGNHGNEGAGPDPARTAACRAAVFAWRAALVDTGELVRIDPAVRFEDKGQTASLHYRGARDADGVAWQLRARVASLAPPARVIGGKLVLNLLPPRAADKAQAFADLCARLQPEAALFVGDDDTDEVVFRLALARCVMVSVRVGYRASSAAQLFVHGPAEVLTLLRLLLRPPRP